MTPDLVFFSAKDYAIFSNGSLKKGAKFTVGVNSSNTLVMTVNAVGHDFYECIDSKGSIHAIDWNIDDFNSKQKMRNKNKCAFYKIINYGN